MLSLILGNIAVFLGLVSLLICILSLLVIGVAAPLGLMKINLTEEMEDFSTSIDETAESLVDGSGRASRRLFSLITFALLASFNFLTFNLARTVQHGSRSVEKTTKLLITALSWPVRCIHRGARILFSSRSSHTPKPSPTAHLEHEIKELRSRAMGYGESVRKLYEEMQKHKRAAYADRQEALQAKKAKNRQNALVSQQQKTIETLQKDIAAFPQEHIQLREKNVALEQKVDDLEAKLSDAIKARDDAEQRKRRTAEKANSMVTDAQNLQHQAEVEKDQAESYFKRAETQSEERQKASASEIFKLKQEIAKRSRIDPRIYLQTVEQVHTLHSERDDARDALNMVTAQLEEARTAEAAGKSQLENLREELERVRTQTGRQLYTVRKELAKSKAEAEREVKAARNESDQCRKNSEADRKELTKAQRSLEETESKLRTEIFNSGLEHNGEMYTAQAKIRNLEESTGDLRALNNALDEKLMHAEEKARLPRDPELQDRLTLATAEIQRLRNEHDTELKGVRKEHKRKLQRVQGDHATELQNREAEILGKCEEAYAERSAEWNVEKEKLGKQVDHWKLRAHRAEGNVTALNSAAGRELQQREDEVVKRCEQAYGARLEEHKAAQEQLQGRYDELQSELLHTKEEHKTAQEQLQGRYDELERELLRTKEEHQTAQEQLQGRYGELELELLRLKEESEDFRASVNDGNQQVVADDPAAPTQIPQTLPALMPRREMSSEAEEIFNQLYDEAWLDEYGTANSAVPLQTSPTSPPLEPTLELHEPEPEPTSVLDPHPTPTSTPAQVALPWATSQHNLAPHGRPMRTPASPSKGMAPRGPRKPRSKPNHYTQQRREEEANYDAGLAPKLDYMFFGGPEPARSAPAVAQSVPSGLPGSSGFGKIH